ncbi:hypothetical protein JZ751_017890 [Albula glossodonta]|uniref:Uncharacterized protein n=1 Tax=Albula glossodonta TaxID=121402 RepID=A0A8T2PPP7_9TELE|nr:hypothetical protein JZ751_017890 [Albula glossodonta]
MLLPWELLILLSLKDCLAEKTVLHGPVFTQEPSDNMFPLNSDDNKVFINCKAKGNPAPTYRWKFNGRDIDLGTDLNYNLVEGNLLINKPEASRHGGTYQCIAGNSIGTVVSREARVQFAYLENFSSKPRNPVSVREGQAVVLLCGPPPHSGEIKYSWIFNGRSNFLQQDTRRFVSQRTGNLYIAKVEPSDVGNYTCVVRSAMTNTTVFSSPTPVVLRRDAVMGEYEPKIEVQFAETSHVAKGSSVKLECFALGKASYSWRKGGDTLKNSKRQTILEDGSLRITNVSKADGGRYTCVARNPFGASSSTGTLVVKEPTKITVPPLNMDATVGESIVLPCEVSKDPSLDPTFKWFFNGKLIDFSRQDHFEMIGGEARDVLSQSEMRISFWAGTDKNRPETSSAPPPDWLECVSAAADLIVRGPPGAPEGLTVEEVTDTTARLSWGAGSDNRSPVTMYNVQARTPFSIGWQSVRTVPDSVPGQMLHATVVGLSPWVDYEFRVVASNSVGVGEPSPPSKLLRTKAAVPEVAPANVSGGGGSRCELVILWETVVASADASTYVFKNESIPPLSPFEVKVGVFNNIGEGPFSHVTTVYSAEEEPAVAPSWIWPRTLSASEIGVFWEPVSWKSSSGRVLGYEVLYWEEGELESSAQRLRVTDTMANITGLKGSTSYLVAVKAYNTPSQPPGNIEWNLTNSKIFLNWEHVKAMDNESEVIGYKVVYRENWHRRTTVVETNRTSVELELPPGEDYLIEIKTLSDGGDGSSSGPIRIPKMSSLNSRGHLSSDVSKIPSACAFMFFIAASWIL